MESGTVYDSLNVVLKCVDYYRLQRNEGAILVNLIASDGTMQLRLCSKIPKLQMQNATSAASRRKLFLIHQKAAKIDTKHTVLVSGGLSDLRRLLAMNGSCGLLNIA